MTPPVLAELTYQAWVVRRTPEGGLRVLLHAFAHGRGDVLIPLPWPEARLLDEEAPHGHFWALWDFMSVRWFSMPWIAPSVRSVAWDSPPSSPPGQREGPSPRAEPVARLLSREDLPSDVQPLVPQAWDFAKSFLWWPAQPAPRGVAGRVARALSSRRRELLPLALAAGGAGTSFFRADPSRIEMLVAASASATDVYAIDPQSLWCPEYGGTKLYHASGLSLSGWADAPDEVCWRRTEGEAPQLLHFKLSGLA